MTGNELKQWQIDKGMTQIEAAFRLGISPDHMAKQEQRGEEHITQSVARKVNKQKKSED